MNVIDLRNNFRESPTGQQILEQRNNPYPYGSLEWRDYILQHGLQFPPYDRRAADRRGAGQHPHEIITPEKPYIRILLTPAERKLLEDIYLSELD